MRVQTARSVAVLGMLATCVLARTARADDVENEARASYDRGVAAHDRGDEETAAREFAHADELKPSNAALEAAAASAIRANDAVFGMTIAERAKGRELDAETLTTIRRAETLFSSKVVAVVVDCGVLSACTVSIDGAPAVDAHGRVYAESGPHRIVVSRGENRQFTTFDARAAEIVRVAEPDTSWHDPNPQTPPPVEARSDWAKPVAIGAIGVTLVLAGVTVASFADLRVTRSDFDRENCGTDAPATATPGSDCARFASSGRAAETRTNLLLAGSILAGAATAAFVIVARPFAPKSDVRVTASLGGAFLSIRTP